MVNKNPAKQAFNDAATAIGMQVLRRAKVAHEMGKHVDKRLPFWGPAELVDLLGLVGVHLTVVQVKKLDGDQVRQVGHWASLEYLAASDNDVKRKPRPACLGAA